MAPPSSPDLSPLSGAEHAVDDAAQLLGHSGGLAAPGGADGGGGIAVFALSPVLTITVEASPSFEDEIHPHAGGQGVWVARMGAILGAEVTLCAALGGESGHVLSELIASQVSRLRVVPTASANGAYIHDRRSGRREPVAAVPSPRLQRHEVDELFGAMTAASLTLKWRCYAAPSTTR